MPAPSPRTRNCVRRFLTWTGVGMLAAGALVGALVPLLFGYGLGLGLVPVLRVFFWALAALAGWLTLLQLLERVPEEQRQEAARHPVLLGWFLAAGAAGMTVLETPLWLFGAGLPASGSTPWQAVGWAGLAALTGGAALVAAFGRNHRPRWAGAPLAGLACGTAAVLLLAAAGWAAADRALVSHTTAEAAASRPVPATVRRTAWTWHPPAGTLVHRVLGTAVGAVADVGDGVVALDPATGREVWHYRRLGAEVDANVTPDGRTVVLAFTLHDHRGDWDALLTLDAATGRPHGDAPLRLGRRDNRGHGSGRPGRSASVDLLTADARILLEQDGGGWRLTARSLSTDERVWEAPLAPECLVDRRPSTWIRTFPDTVVVAQRCHEELDATAHPGARWPRSPRSGAGQELRGGVNRLTAFDAATGEQRWRTEQPEDGPVGPNPEISYHRNGPRSHLYPVTSDGSVVAVEKWGSDIRYLVVDRATGEVLAEDLDLTGHDHSAHFTADSVSVVRIDDENGGTLVHERRALDGRLLQKAESRAPFPHVLAGTEWVDLEGAAVMVHLSRDAAAEGGYDVGVTPWDDASAPFTLQLEDTVPLTGILRVRLLPVPGALLVFEDVSDSPDGEPERPVFGLY